jgi:uncharacterized membrane protein YhiD involved in acid resistance
MYRWVAWFGMIVTILLAGWGFLEQWRNLSYWQDTWNKFLSSAGIGAMILIMGLIFCGTAFLVSLLVEAGLKMIANSQTQVDLMRRLVHQQSDVTSTRRLGENTASVQIQPQQEMVEHQRRRAKS